MSEPCSLLAATAALWLCSDAGTLPLSGPHGLSLTRPWRAHVPPAFPTLNVEGSNSAKLSAMYQKAVWLSLLTHTVSPFMTTLSDGHVLSLILL